LQQAFEVTLRPPRLGEYHGLARRAQLRELREAAAQRRQQCFALRVLRDRDGEVAVTCEVAYLALNQLRLSRCSRFGLRPGSVLLARPLLTSLVEHLEVLRNLLR